jgi:hypothetical protein
LAIVWILLGGFDVGFNVFKHNHSTVELLDLEVFKNVLEELILFNVSIAISINFLDVKFDEVVAEQLLLAEDVYQLLHIN